MSFSFLDRVSESARLKKSFGSTGPGLFVVYGRRRCGKSTLLQRVAGEKDVYYLADQSEKALQIRMVAQEVARIAPEFDAVVYPDWGALFTMFASRKNECRALVLDEFPYLVQTSPELPSIIQKYIDRKSGPHIILCGSSQRMMQGLALDAGSPLFGRSREVMKIRPLEASWIKAAFKDRDPVHRVERYAAWGGVPRYWELAAEYPEQEIALKELVFDRDGVLHDEPYRLLLDDMRSAAQPQAILALMGNGCNRLSEIASRSGKPAGHLSRPLETLIDLGYIMRELPFGENLKSSKRTRYKISDPFLLFWYRFIHPNASLLEKQMVNEVFNSCRPFFASHVGQIWESLARDSTFRQNIDGIAWKPGQRWWGTGIDGKPYEIDVAAESLDGNHILIGEAKWEKLTNVDEVEKRLLKIAQVVPFVKGRKVHLACWAKNKPKKTIAEIEVILPDKIV